MKFCKAISLEQCFTTSHIIFSTSPYFYHAIIMIPITWRKIRRRFYAYFLTFSNRFSRTFSRKYFIANIFDWNFSSHEITIGLLMSAAAKYRVTQCTRVKISRDFALTFSLFTSSHPFVSLYFPGNLWSTCSNATYYLAFTEDIEIPFTGNAQCSPFLECFERHRLEEWRARASNMMMNKISCFVPWC